jgi:hypothetical protein
VHGKDEVKKLPITVQEEGLMYNPINMHIEDRDRLYQKDLRDKNKRKRFEVRYDVEADTRKDGMAQFEREQQMKVNKISLKRYEETLNRGFDILTNDPIDNDDDGPANAESQPTAEPKTSKTQVYEYYRTLQDQKREPRVWSKAMNTVNRDFMTDEEKLAVERDEEERKKAILNTSKVHLTSMLTSSGFNERGEAIADISGLNVDRRSQRVRRATVDIQTSQKPTSDNHQRSELASKH